MNPRNLSSRQILAASAGVTCMVVATALALWWRMPPPSLEDRPRHAWSPVEALEFYTRSQEDGDVEGVASMIPAGERDEFNAEALRLSRDELIASGLNFRQEEYALAEETADRATFYSRRSGLYLVMSRIENSWLIDLKRTDWMNGEGGRDPAGGSE